MSATYLDRLREKSEENALIGATDKTDRSTLVGFVSPELAQKNSLSEASKDPAGPRLDELPPEGWAAGERIHLALLSPAQDRNGEAWAEPRSDDRPEGGTSTLPTCAGAPQKAAAPAEIEELTRLARACGAAYGFTEQEHRDAMEVALADPINALRCFRAMAAELGVRSTASERRSA